MLCFVKCLAEVKKYNVCLTFSLFSVLAQSVVVFISCVIVDSLFLKPCRSLIKILL